MLRAQLILALHDASTRHWHTCSAYAAPLDVLGELILAQHRANYDLWHQEDEARSPLVSDAVIAEVKHAIDRINQRRNDLVEQIDSALLEAAGSQNSTAPLHSETPGLIVDRLSILELKIYHTREEVERPSASDAHHNRNQERLALLEHQRADLADCLDCLWAEILAGSRRFSLYRQLKMYNDPELNPVLYRNSPCAPGAPEPEPALAGITRHQFLPRKGD